MGAPYRVPARALRRGIARHHEAVVGLLVALLYAAEFVAFRHIDRALDVITLVALLAVLSEAPPRPRR